MKTIALDKCMSFQCIAGACTSTCCAGWSILVAEKDYARFAELEPEWLREDILNNIQKRANQYYFKNDKDGRCAMLDLDGLCRIQRNTSEEALCNTCRKYPRLVNSIEDTLYLSMAASCPVISEYLVKEEVSWRFIDDSGSSSKVQISDIGIVRDVWLSCQESLQSAKLLQKETKNTEVLYACFEKMTVGILDIILEYQDKTFSLDIFQIMEGDSSAILWNFLKDSEEIWRILVENYIQYRVFSRRIEFPEEEDAVCIRQVQGELLLLRTLAFCKFGREGSLTEKDFTWLLQKVYRFCAHGKKVAEAFQGFIKDFFTQDVFWSYVLL